MRGLLGLISAFCLFASLVGGTIVHVADQAGPSEMTAATQWMHADGDHDQVPPDADNDATHHHNICHGHDLAAPVKACGTPGLAEAGAMLRPIAAVAPGAAPPSSPHRPPIS